MARTATNVLITMMRPNMNGKRGARMARMAKSPKNRDHGCLLQQREKARSRRQSGDGLV